MSVRHFAGGEWLEFAVGSAGVTGAVTIAAVARPSLLDVVFLTQGYNTVSTPAGYGFELGAAGTLGIYSGSDVYGDEPIVEQDQWQILAMSKAAGEAAAEFHSYNFDTGLWLYDVATARSNDAGSIAGGRIRVGEWGESYTYQGDLAAIAIWGSALSATTIETLARAPSLSAWASIASPVSLWLFDQSSTATTVTDRIGAAHQSSAAHGTSVLDEPPPIPYTPAAAGATIRLFDAGSWTPRPLQVYNGASWRQAAGLTAAI